MPVTIKAYTMHCNDDTYTIVLNSRHSLEQLMKAYHHEMKHIENGDEELGHFYTSTGNILDMSDTANRKQEQRARLWAYNKQVGISGIIDCYKAHCRTLHDMAEHLNVTEKFLKDAIDCYRHKYGICTKVDNYVIGFEPTFYVLEMWE